uniref:protein Vhl n=1 Tax=Bactrocera dorsalis TaxID=27457 RepID=A0A034VIS1_BACDO
MALPPFEPPEEEFPFHRNGFYEPPFQPCYVLFFNTTNRHIKLFWFDNKETKYHTSLAPGHHVKTNTFTHHPWIFCDRDSNELMSVHNLPRYWPIPYKMRNPNNPARMVPCRKEIRIQYPLRTLRESCLCRIVNTLNPLHPIAAVKIIDERMSLPHILKKELKRRLRRPLGTEPINEEWEDSIVVKYNIPRNQ